MSFLENAKEISPCILLIDNAIDNAQEVIDRGISKASNDGSDGVQDATVFSSASSLEVQKNVRNTKRIDISPVFSNDVFWWILAQKLWQYGDAYGKKYGVPFSVMEHPQLLWYKKNEGFYKPHSDTGPNDSGLKRSFSCVLYLNDVEEGGETHFERLNIAVRPKAGRLILFPADFTHLHGANTPLSGDKFAVVSWFGY